MLKFEPGQIQNPENFPTPRELVCIQVPKVFDQAALRDCQTITALLLTIVGTPTVTFECVKNFDITNVKVVSRRECMATTPGYKNLKLSVTLEFDIFFAINGVTAPTPIHSSATYNLAVNNIYCPNCCTQIGLVRYPEGTTTVDLDGILIKVEALAEAFNDHITIAGDGTTYTYTLTLDIGVFFLVKCECEVQLLIPAYDYCPIPPEQSNIFGGQTCCSFKDRRCTPFPTAFYPNQKQNVLDADLK